MDKTKEIPFGVKDSDLCSFEYTIPDGYEAEIKDGKVIVRKVESEEERVRKALISVFSNREKYLIDQSFGDITVSEALAWLEKQGEHAKFRDSIQVGDKVTRNEDGVLVNLSQLKRVAKPVELQQDMLSQEKYAKAVDECIYGEQNPADKVEPKFHEGDWVVTSYGKVNQVVSVDKDGDGYTLDDGVYFSGSWCDMYHLWTIQDAKDGDVLVSSSGKPFIFKGFFDNDPMAYGGLVADDSFWPASNSNWTTVYCKPATKEQRDLLFQKMKEAGYSFDFEKKELKKIEQKPAENKGMNLAEENMTPFQKKVFCIIDTTIEEEHGLKQVCDELLRLAHDEIIQKSTWSEDDEKIYAATIFALAGFMGNEDKINWLKSLKERVLPQNTWKPSDAQMDSITCAVRKMKESACYDSELVSLFNDLKKLKEAYL